MGANRSNLLIVETGNLDLGESKSEEAIAAVPTSNPVDPFYFFEVRRSCIASLKLAMGEAIAIFEKGERAFLEREQSNSVF